MLRILKILMWTALPVLVFAVGKLAQNHYGNKKVKSLIVDIDYRQHGETNRFLTYEDVNTFVRRRYDSIQGKTLEQVNIEHLEQGLKDIPYVKSADAFATMDADVHLRIKQRRALVRVVDAMGDQFYLDEDARILPIRSFFPARVPVCNGHIKSVGFYAREHTPEQLDSMVENSMLKDIYNMAKYIDSDSLLRVQIVQMNVDVDGEFVLVPLVSNHIIKFGEPQDIEEKFEKLKIFYTDGLGHHKWNNYKVLNLKYKNQIVCTKI